MSNITIEREIEQYLVRQVEKQGGKCIKFIPDNRVGMPDRIVLFPHGHIVWVELKKPKGGVLSDLQKHRHKELRNLGQRVVVCWTREDVDTLTAEYAE